MALLMQLPAEVVFSKSTKRLYLWQKKKYSNLWFFKPYMTVSLNVMFTLRLNSNAKKLIMWVGCSYFSIYIKDFSILVLISVVAIKQHPVRHALVCSKWELLWDYGEYFVMELELSIFVMCEKSVSISLKPMWVLREPSSSGLRSEASVKWHLTKPEMSSYQCLEETGLKRWERLYLPVHFLYRVGYAFMSLD